MLRSQRLRLLFLLCLLLTIARPAAAAPDYTDIWWNPAENGWGVNLVQGQGFLFATFFIYGPDQQPFWYTGQLLDDGTGVFNGALYLSSGSYYATPWDVTRLSIHQVGTVSFRPTAADAGILTYTVGDVSVTKNIVRQTLNTIVLGGSYIGGVVADQFGCTNPLSNTTSRVHADMTMAQFTDGTGQLDFTLDGGLACTIRGALVQRGRLYSMTGATYTCSSGLATTANVTELHATAAGLEGRWVASVSGGCSERGTFGGVLK